MRLIGTTNPVFPFEDFQRIEIFSSLFKSAHGLANRPGLQLCHSVYIFVMQLFCQICSGFTVLWTLNAVSLSGRGLPRLNGISLEIPEGVTAVLGQSGMGKTSLLNLLIGIERPTGGKIRFHGTASSGRLPLFWVPPQHGLWPHLSVREHLTTVSPQGTSQNIDAEEELLTKFDLLELADAKPGSLSLGEKSRLNVARALASHASVLVMDEPLSHVDSSRSGKYWQGVREHSRARGTSIVLATHSPEVALREATNVICLKNGRVVYSGDVTTLYEKPSSRELAELLGPCNWLPVDEAKRWLSRPLAECGSERLEAPDCQCIRPECLEVQSTAESPLLIEESRFAGSSAEIVVHDERSGATQNFVCRPQGSTRLKRGDRVILRVIQLMMIVVTLSGCFGDSSPVLPVKHESNWSMPPDGARVPAPRGMTVSSTDEYLVLDNAGRVLAYDRNGDLQKQWWMPEYAIGKAEGILVLKDGRIAVADTHYHRIVFFDHDGNFTGTFGQRGSEPGDFVYPVKIAQDPEENLYICEYGQNDRVQKFRPDGTFLLQFGGPGIEPGKFQRPSGIVWFDHKLYVVDAFNNRIQVFTDEGKLVAILGESDRIAEVHYPYDITVDQNGDLYAVEYKAGRVSKFSRSGRLLGRYGSSGPGQTAAQFSTPWGLTIDRRGRLYVCDTGNRRIVELEL